MMHNASVCPPKGPLSSPLAPCLLYVRALTRGCAHTYIVACFFFFFLCVWPSRRRLPPRDPPSAPDHHGPDARPASDAAEPSARHHAHPHAPDSPDPELGARTGGQSAPGAGAARARVRDHLHAVRVSLHPHALHIGISHRLHRSFRYVDARSSSLSYIVNGCITRTGYLAPMSGRRARFLRSGVVFSRAWNRNCGFIGVVTFDLCGSATAPPCTLAAKGSSCNTSTAPVDTC